MVDKSNKTSGGELAQAEERVAAIKAELAQALIRRNSLPKSATDEEKEAAANHVAQLQSAQHEAMQQVLAIRREETARIEREHKERKQRHKKLKASRQSGGHAPPQEDVPSPTRRDTVRPPRDRDAEEAVMDAANAHDLFLERQRLEEEDIQSEEELAIQRRKAEKKWRKELAAQQREARQRERAQAKARAEAERIAAEKKERAKARQQAALQRADAAKAEKRRKRAEREARQGSRASTFSSNAGLRGLWRTLKALFGGD